MKSGRSFSRLMCVMCLPILLWATSSMAYVDMVKVVKSQNRMLLLNGDRVVKEFHVALGTNPKGHKRREGDARTPEGLYTLDLVKENSDFYRAIRISYPNDKDKANAKKHGVKPGGQIMIHGQRNGFEWAASVRQKRNWTEGCIALTNEEMDEFLALVDVGTPIHIAW
ncbi:L,D-transpeptidase family protein [Aliiglaciecola sp. CAU 1673]|uniref:L,D-transpeptidase family protein n=1 Tax=Aliiglaciecola sp. CAU 1673 TaxID=3032595 RepID=UPI0023DB4379|nr:L,D-transpeptidase family protein [Aliiglaciecola sp. CAU 1673]MDF2176962.1 L,D-transpeptidase family protein [Aliiglaciecola sp. CAU 1673]